jgi:hypothetical protein
MHPVLAIIEVAEGNDTQVADASAHLVWNGRGKRFHRRVGKLIAGAEARDHRNRKTGVRQSAPLASAPP